MNRTTRAQLKQISDKLSEILQNDSSEQIMVFTDDKVLKELCGQINLLLLDRQKMKADFIRQELSSKKMLANISHDIKTPLTVILGYLEIMHFNLRRRLKSFVCLNHISLGIYLTYVFRCHKAF